MLSLLQHSHATWNIIWSIFSDFLFNTKAFVLQAHDEQDKENEGRTGKTTQNIWDQLTKFPLLSDWFLLIRALMSSKSRFNSRRSDLKSFKSDSLSFACSCLVSINLYTVCENHRKSLIQHCERSELCWHSDQKCQNG